MMGAQERTRVAAVGDSITAGTPSWDPDPKVRAGLDGVPDEQSQFCYWVEHLAPHFEMANHGIDRQTTAEILSRTQAAIGDAHVLVAQGGINDIVAGLPVEEAAENLRAMIRLGHEAGLRVVVVEVLPCNGISGLDHRIRRLNELIHEVAAAERVPSVPFYGVLEDPDRSGRMREDWTSDGNHPSVEGHRRLGKALASALENALENGYSNESKRERDEK